MRRMPSRRLIRALTLFVPCIANVLMIVKAINGQRFLIPGISDFADKF